MRQIMARQRRLTPEQGRAFLRLLRAIDRDCRQETGSPAVVFPDDAFLILRALNFDQPSIDLMVDLYDEG